MRLITCVYKSKDSPGPVHLHPCSKAIEALDKAGHTYQHDTVDGVRGLPWTLKNNRDEILELTGQKLVPVLILDDGTAINGSGKIADWAKANAPSGA